MNQCQIPTAKNNILAKVLSEMVFLTETPSPIEPWEPETVRFHAHGELDGESTIFLLGTSNRGELVS